MKAEELIEIKQCPYCGKKYFTEDKFCTNCGREFIKISCRRCGEILINKNVTYCPKCGTKYPVARETERKIEEIASKPAKGDSEDGGEAVVMLILLLAVGFVVVASGGAI